MEIAASRRSVRAYLPEPVPREMIIKCIEAARLAPSACNSQPWRFIVIDEPETKNKVAEAAFSGIYKGCSFAATAPVLVAVINEKGNLVSRLGGIFRKTPFSLIDIGIAVEHFVLQATELGLGTCWLGWFNIKAVKKILRLPWNTDLVLLIAAGYPDNTKQFNKTSRKSFDEIASFFTK